MLSFPSSFSRGGASLYQVGKKKITTVKTPNDDVFENIQSRNLKLSPEVVKSIYENDNKFIDFKGYHPTNYVFKENKTSLYYEDPLKMDIRMLRGMNTYQFMYSKAIKQLYDISLNRGNSSGNTYDLVQTTTAASPSLFNPTMGVNVIGISENMPLLNNVKSKYHYQIYEPTIENLVKASKGANGILGNARYKLADFLYCKDLGKVSNNHLITLRKFATPIGDHIYKWSTSRGYSKGMMMQTSQDIGRLIAWFDTEDNRLEDICTYEMSMEWKEIHNEIQEIDSKEDSESRGILGAFINTTNKAYNSFQNSVYGGPGNSLISRAGNSILSHLGSKFHIDLSQKANDNLELQRMSSDQHKVWEPANTVRDTHLYDGKLTLSQDINLTFSYKLRAYDNINPKSAMLDLIGNVLEVTYQRGTYWKGSRRWIGPPQNKQSWENAYSFIDKKYEDLGGLVASLADGSLKMSDILGNIANYLNELKSQLSWENIKNMAETSVEELKSLGVDGITQKVAQLAKVADDKFNIGGALGGLLKSSIGRPSLYAMNSLVDGGPCGFWHLTIGNPFNPIMCIGNLIMTSSKVTQCGPLGVDDFPSELKVTVSLKPGRSRDATEISRYYTKGIGSIYLPKHQGRANDYHNFGNNFNSGQYSNWEDQLDNPNQQTSDENGNQITKDRISEIVLQNAGTFNDILPSNSNPYYETEEQGVVFMAGTNNPAMYYLANREHSR